MFESIKSMSEKEEECEECGHKDILVDAIIDGQLKRICQRCVKANQNNVIVIKRPPQIKEEDVPRRSVHEILEEMSGIKPKPIKKPLREIKLEDLRERYEKIKEKRRLQNEKEKEPEERKERTVGVLDEKKFIDELEKERKEEKKEALELKEEGNLDFSIDATKHMKIRDLLERMKNKNQTNLKENLKE